MDQCGTKPRDRRKLVSIVGVTFGALAVVAFLLRVWSKLVGSGGSFGLDDWAMTVTIVCACGTMKFNGGVSNNSSAW